MKFEKAYIEVITFNISDVITASPTCVPDVCDDNTGECDFG